MMEYDGFSRKKWSGPGKDIYRDPTMITDILPSIIKKNRWNDQLLHGKLLYLLPNIMGQEIYEKIQTVELEGNVLKIQAKSTAWATQLRYMERDIIAKINNAQTIVITRILISGPKPPSWRFGAKHISGRGPRDTYG